MVLTLYQESFVQDFALTEQNTCKANIVEQINKNKIKYLNNKNKKTSRLAIVQKKKGTSSLSNSTKNLLVQKLS